LINEATLILEGESNEKVVNRLKTISSKLEEKLQTFDKSLMGLIDVKNTEEDIMESDLITDNIE